MVRIDLTDGEAAALLRELDGLTDADHYFLSPRVKTLKAIRPKSGRSLRERVAGWAAGFLMGAAV
jgi:hypothetical protein